MKTSNAVFEGIGGAVKNKVFGSIRNRAIKRADRAWHGVANRFRAPTKRVQPHMPGPIANTLNSKGYKHMKQQTGLLRWAGAGLGGAAATGAAGTAYAATR